MAALIFVRVFMALSPMERTKMNKAQTAASYDGSLGDPEPLILANDNNCFITHKGHQEPAQLARQEFLQSSSLKVIDEESLKLIQVLRLHKAIDYSHSAIGSAVLLRSLIQPSTDLHLIQSKQAALIEVASNDTMRQALQDFITTYRKSESDLFKFFNKGLYALFPYVDVKRAKRSARSLFKRIPPKAESVYLNGLLACLHAYKGSSIDQMMRGSIYKTLGGLKSGQEVSWLTPKLKFIPRRFTKWILVGPAIASAPYVLAKAGLGIVLSPLLTSIGIGLTGICAFYSLFIKPVRDTGKYIEPFREACVYDNTFNQAIDAIGKIDELLALHQFARDVPHATTLPKMLDEPHHSFEATGLKNPVLSKEDTGFVPNNIHMNGSRLTFVSGPNSGGKTTICKSIIHNQLLAQIGSYVLAETATINIADMISYQAPKFDGLQDDEGRFGTELSRTRDIFYSTSPKSLVILDELAEGTTYEERLDESFGILSDFHTIGNNTILVTHNHSLVDRFMDAHKGQCLMAEFNEGDPTYKIIPGISRKAHADRIVKKIKFSQADRHTYMKRKGYL